MQLFWVVLCCLWGTLDSWPAPVKENGIVLTALGTAREKEQERPTLADLVDMIKECREVAQSYNESLSLPGSKLDNLAIYSLDQLMSEFRLNQFVIDSVEFFDRSKQSTDYLLETGELRCQFWLLEADLLLNWVRELRPDSMTATDRLSRILEDSGFSIDEVGSDPTELTYLKGLADHQRL